MLAFLFFLPHLRGAPVGDDWPVFAAVGRAESAEPLRWLNPLRPGWYRPLSHAYAALTWRLFGREGAPHRLLGAVLFAATTLAVMRLTVRVSGEPRAGPLAGLVFATGATHAEPVLWIAAHNELLAGLLATVSLLAYARYARTLRGSWLLAAAGTCCLAVMAKETALGLPLAMASIAALLPASGAATERAGRGRLRTALPALVLAVAAALLVLARSGGGLPYDVSTHPLQLMGNMAFSGAMLLVAVPADGGLLHASFAPGSRLVAAWPAAAAAAALVGLGILALRWRAWRGCSSCRRGMGVAAVVCLAGMLPAAAIVTERTAYLPSVGAAMGLGLLLARLHRLAGQRGPPAVAAVTLLAAAYLLASTTAAQGRARYWSQAAVTSDAVMSQLAAAARVAPTGSTIVVTELPDRHGPAVLFLNAFPAAAEVWPVPAPVLVTAAAPGEGRVVALRYDAGPPPRLVPSGGAAPAATPRPPGGLRSPGRDAVPARP